MLKGPPVSSLQLLPSCSELQWPITLKNLSFLSSFDGKTLSLSSPNVNLETVYWMWYAYVININPCLQRKDCSLLPIYRFFLNEAFVGRKIFICYFLHEDEYSLEIHQHSYENLGEFSMSDGQIYYWYFRLLFCAALHMYMHHK